MRPRRAIRSSAFSATAVLALSALVLSACGIGRERAAPPAGSASGNAAPSESAAPATPTGLFKPPADACSVLPAEFAKQIKVLTSARTGKDPLSCNWDLDGGDKYKSRRLGVTYKTDDLKLTKRFFESAKRNDLSRGRGANITKIETASEVQQVGSQKQGEHFDEGYYFYTNAEIAGLTLGHGTVALRRGNTVIEISASGHDVLPPYTGKLRSNPLPNQACMDVIDKVADVFAGAVVAE